MLSTKIDVREIPEFELHQIKTIRALKDFKLELSFENGVEGIVDLKTTISEGGVFSEINEPESFNEVQVGRNGRYVFWKNEIEIDADSLYLEITTVRQLK